MALDDQSYKFYLDAALNNPMGSRKAIGFSVDLSSGPVEFPVYYGSTVADRILTTFTNPGVDDIVISPFNSVPGWTATTTFTQFQAVQPSVPTGTRFEALVVSGAGQTGATEPDWSTANAVGSTLIDGDITWINVGAIHAETEVKLALTQGGLDAATPGAGVALGTEILGGVANAAAFWVRVTNTVQTVGNTTNKAGLRLVVNHVLEDQQIAA